MHSKYATDISQGMHYVFLTEVEMYVEVCGEVERMREVERKNRKHVSC